MSNEMDIGGHFYQPPRKSFHEGLQGACITDDGIDWTVKASRESYEPLAQEGMWNKISFEVSPLLLVWMETNAPAVLDAIRKTGGKHAVGTPYAHVLMPDASEDDKDILIGAGVKRFKEDFKDESGNGIQPSIAFVPETAVDTPTLKKLVKHGYRGVIVAPWQVKNENGQDIDQPTRIDLSQAKSIVAIPYDREVSSKLSFSEEKYDAWEFARKHILGKLHNLRIQLEAWSDGELYGHHWKKGEKFLQALIDYVFPYYGVQSRSVNQLDLSNTPNGTLVERSAWSCEHGDLARWNYGCPCTDFDNSWKFPFYQLFKNFNMAVAKIVKGEFGIEYVPRMTDGFEVGFKNHGKPNSTPEKSLEAANVASILTRISCNTYFPEPHTAGHVAPLQALTSVQHLRDAGLTRKARNLEQGLMAGLEQIQDPINHSQNLRAIAENFFRDKKN